MMKMEYWILNPSGNRTALVTSRHAVKDYTALNARLLREHPNVEQVGFVDLSADEPFLRMAGGEFCGNATLCAGVLRAAGTSLPCTASVRVYGCEQPFPVTVEPAPRGYLATVRLPKPSPGTPYTTVLGGKKRRFAAVHLPGITHLIADASLDRATAERLARQAAEEWHEPAVGVMLFDKAAERLTPLVYVRTIDSCFWEQSCASGSCALAAELAANSGESLVLRLQEPGGVLTVRVANDTPFVSLTNTVIPEEHLVKEW